MAITNLEKEIIKETAKFLENLGYTRTEDRYSVKYTLNDICISIVYPPNSDESEVNIRFIKKNKVFSVGWIAFVRENIKGNGERITNVKELLNYIENHYFQILDYQFCEESNLLIDKYVTENYERFEEAVRTFLREN